ncbi:MAG: hypothetical protein MZV70_53770 [Desulfobacterales bacterium]|nr:hypothetical protein [Desulfobacterales bacterium]
MRTLVPWNHRDGAAGRTSGSWQYSRYDSGSDGAFFLALLQLDFAGGTVVHINAGIAGLVARLHDRQARRLRHASRWRRTA